MVNHDNCVLNNFRFNPYALPQWEIEIDEIVCWQMCIDLNRVFHLILNMFRIMSWMYRSARWMIFRWCCTWICVCIYTSNTYVGYIFIWTPSGPNINTPTNQPTNQPTYSLWYLPFPNRTYSILDNMHFESTRRTMTHKSAYGKSKTI